VKASLSKRAANRHEARNRDRARVWTYAQHAGLFNADEAAQQLGMSAIYVGRLLAELRVENRLARRVVRNCKTTVQYQVLT
jgi:DNA-binding transcriptional regulator LsrR (DeoR family)